MFKLDLEKKQKNQIKLPTSAGSQKKEENSRKTSTSASLTMLKPLTMWITTNWKILRDGNTKPPYLPVEKPVCRLRSKLKPNVEQQIGPELVKEYDKAVLCHLAYLTYMQENIMRNARLNEAQTGIKTAGRNINNLRYADGTTLIAESKDELKTS